MRMDVPCGAFVRIHCLAYCCVGMWGKICSFQGSKDYVYASSG